MTENQKQMLRTALITTSLSVFIPACMGASITPVMRSFTLQFAAELYKQFAGKKMLEAMGREDHESLQYWMNSIKVVSFLADIYPLTSYGNEMFKANEQFQNKMIGAISSSSEVCSARPMTYGVVGSLLSPSFWGASITLNLYDQLIKKARKNTAALIIGNEFNDVGDRSVSLDIADATVSACAVGGFSAIGGYKLVGMLPLIGRTVTDRAAGREL